VAQGRHAAQLDWPAGRALVMAPHAPRAAAAGALAAQLLGVAVNMPAWCSHASWGWSSDPTPIPAPIPSDSPLCALLPHVCNSPASTPESTSDPTPAPTRAPTPEPDSGPTPAPARTSTTEPASDPTTVPTGDTMTSTSPDGATTPEPQPEPEMQTNAAQGTDVCIAALAVSLVTTGGVTWLIIRG